MSRAEVRDGRALKHRLDPERLVFIDENWIKTNMVHIRSWGPKDKRPRAFAPHGHWCTLPFLRALRKDQLAAPCVFDGPINDQCFRAFVEQQLVPVLKLGDIVVRDNLGSRKMAAVRQDQSRRRAAVVSAALFAGPQSNRAGFREDKTLDARRTKADQRRDLAAYRHLGRDNPTRRMLRISQKCRIRFRQKGETLSLFYNALQAIISPQKLLLPQGVGHLIHEGF